MVHPDHEDILSLDELEDIEYLQSVHDLCSVIILVFISKALCVLTRHEKNPQHVFGSSFVPSLLFVLKTTVLYLCVIRTKTTH